MAYTVTDIKELFLRKLHKYKTEERTLELKNTLFEETIAELNRIEQINERSNKDV